MSDDGHAVDTGPLLCFGAIPRGPRIAWRHLSPMSAPPAVVHELQDAASRQDRMGQAAQVWLGTRGDGLAKDPLTDEQVLAADSMQSALHASAPAERIRDGRDDRGEAECLALATANNQDFATNDRLAACLATDHDVLVVTTAELLRRDHETGEQSIADIRKAIAMMEAAGLDLGENISGPLDLIRRRRRP